MIKRVTVRCHALYSMLGMIDFMYVIKYDNI